MVELLFSALIQLNNSLFLSDLFSSFDYSTSSWLFLEYSGKLNWLIGLMTFFVLLMKGGAHILFHGFQQNNSSANSHSTRFHLYFFKILLILVGLNLMGLSPYMFSNTSHIFFVFFISAFFWVSLLLSNMMSKPLSFLYLFFPKSPGFILPFLNLMEIVSFFMRPITLMLRLSIKMTTGHIFVVLLSSCFTYLFLSGSSILFFVFPVSLFLFFFESCMGIIQGIVFFLLLHSYLGEHK